MTINWNNENWVQPSYEIGYTKTQLAGFKSKSKPNPKQKQGHTFKVGDIAQITESKWDYRVGRYIKITGNSSSTLGNPLVSFEYLENDEELAKQEVFTKPFNIAARKLRFVA